MATCVRLVCGETVHLKIDVLRGAQKLSFDISAVEARGRIGQLAGVADPTKNRIEPPGVFGLNLDDGLGSMLPDVHIGTSVIVVGRVPGCNSISTGLRAGGVIGSLNRTFWRPCGDLNPCYRRESAPNAHSRPARYCLNPCIHSGGQ